MLHVVPQPIFFASHDHHDTVGGCKYTVVERVLNACLPFMIRKFRELSTHPPLVMVQGNGEGLSRVSRRGSKSQKFDALPFSEAELVAISECAQRSQVPIPPDPIDQDGHRAPHWFSCGLSDLHSQQ